VVRSREPFKFWWAPTISLERLIVLWRYERRYRMSKMGWLGAVRVTQGHWAFHSNYVPILHPFWDIARYWSKIADLNLPHLYLAPHWGWTRWNLAEFFRFSKLESMGVVCAILSLATLVQCQLVQTDGRRTHDDIPR